MEGKTPQQQLRIIITLTVVRAPAGFYWPSSHNGLAGDCKLSQGSRGYEIFQGTRDSELSQGTRDCELSQGTGDFELSQGTGDCELSQGTGGKKRAARGAQRRSTVRSHSMLTRRRFFFVICNFIDLQQLALNCDLETKTFRRSKIHLPQSPISMLLLFVGCLKLHVNNCHILDKGYKISKFFAWTPSWFRAASTL